MGLDFNAFCIIVQVIFLEGILSIDNAAVLGAMVSILPQKEKVPWPGPLKFLESPVHRLLGGQRSAALKVGLLGAYFGRGLMLLLANFVIHNHILKFLGAGYLIKLAFENLGELDSEESQANPQGLEGKKFWRVVLAVELADLAFSLDNVVAVVALSNNLYFVMFGVAIGILLMRFAASIFTYMIIKEPILKLAAYLVIFNIGAELLLSEIFGLEISTGLKFAISAGTMILAVFYARFKSFHFLRPVFILIGRGMVKIDEFLNWIIALGVRPFKFLLKLTFSNKK